MMDNAILVLLIMAVWILGLINYKIGAITHFMHHALVEIHAEETEEKNGIHERQQENSKTEEHFEYYKIYTINSGGTRKSKRYFRIESMPHVKWHAVEVWDYNTREWNGSNRSTYWLQEHGTRITSALTICDRPHCNNTGCLECKQSPFSTYTRFFHNNSNLKRR